MRAWKWSTRAVECGVGANKEETDAIEVISSLQEIERRVVAGTRFLIRKGLGNDTGYRRPTKPKLGATASYPCLVLEDIPWICVDLPRGDSNEEGNKPS